MRSPLSKKERRKKKERKKLAKSKTRKGGLSQKWASRWTENPKGRSRQKLGAYKKIYSRWIENPKERSRQKLGILKKNNTKKRWWKKTKTKTEVSQFKWVKWKNALCASLQMATSVRLIDWWGFIPRNGVFSPGLMNGDFCLWFN